MQKNNSVTNESIFPFFKVAMRDALLTKKCAPIRKSFHIVRHHHIHFPPSKNLYTTKNILSISHLHTSSLLNQSFKDDLQSRLSILDQLLKVGLVPLSSLRTRRESIRHTTERIITGGARITGTIRLATRLDPHECINQRIARGARGPHAEARALDVAPVTPFLAEASDAVAGGVDDGLGGHAGGLEFGGEEGDELLFVLRFVVLGVGGFGEFAGGQIVGVPAGNVGGDTADLLGGACGFVGFGKFLGTGLWGDGLVWGEVYG
jgi:hypothetical protein